MSLRVGRVTARLSRWRSRSESECEQREHESYVARPEVGDLSMARRTPGNTGWRAEPVDVEKLWMSWIGVNGQSNPVIAGSLRNSFRASPGHCPAGVELPVDEGPYRMPTSSELRIPRGFTPGVRRRGIAPSSKGKQPRRRLRPQSLAEWIVGSGGRTDSQDVGQRQPSFEDRVLAHCEWPRRK